MPWVVRGNARTTGWGGFAVWGLVGAFFSFSVLFAASIGLFLLPVAVLALVAVCIFVRVWPEIVGILEGLAALGFYVGLADLTLASGGVALPWLLGGLVLGAAGLAVYSLAGVRP